MSRAQHPKSPLWWLSVKNPSYWEGSYFQSWDIEHDLYESINGTSNLLWVHLHASYLRATCKYVIGTWKVTLYNEWRDFDTGYCIIDMHYRGMTTDPFAICCDCYGLGFTVWECIYRVFLFFLTTFSTIYKSLEFFNLVLEVLLYQKSWP